MTELISSEQLRVCNAGKKVMQIMTLHCESIYTANMTESMFLDAVYENIDVQNRTLESVNFFKKVYFYLSTYKSVEEIDEIETGELTFALYQKAKSSSAQSSVFSVNSEITEVSFIGTILKIIILIILLLLPSSAR